MPGKFVVIAEDMKIPVDTSYEGAVMLTSELYKSFMKAELPKNLWRSYRTLSGTVTIHTARAVIKICNQKIETLSSVGENSC